MESEYQRHGEMIRTLLNATDGHPLKTPEEGAAMVLAFVASYLPGGAHDALIDAAGFEWKRQPMGNHILQPKVAKPATRIAISVSNGVVTGAASNLPGVNIDLCDFDALKAEGKDRDERRAIWAGITRGLHHDVAGLI